MFDVLIAGGDVYDGSGAGPVPADVGVRGDRVAAVGRGLPREAGTVVDAAGKAVCPGFINILSHSHLSILHDCYASHVRGEGEQLHAALGEFLRIVREAGLRGEVFHLKALGRPNWHLMDGAISLIEQARSAGLPVTADVYPYTAGSGGLTSIIPARYHEGGAAALYDRLGVPGVRGPAAAPPPRRPAGCASAPLRPPRCRRSRRGRTRPARRDRGARDFDRQRPRRRGPVVVHLRTPPGDHGPQTRLARVGARRRRLGRGHRVADAPVRRRCASGPRNELGGGEQPCLGTTGL